MDIMTKRVAIATVDDDLDYAINTMKREKIRHLPIAEGKKVVGIISMRDILGFQYEENKAEIKYINLLHKKISIFTRNNLVSANSFPSGKVYDTVRVI
ncbi:MAG: CBS domain-containing protein [Desulfobacterales bacterium]|nr:CBS domain-containing protein [Desulfobacterales bacterium]